MEIPDVIVVNKSDHPLTDTMVREIRGVLSLGAAGGLARADREDRGRRAARGSRSWPRRSPSTARSSRSRARSTERRRRNLMNEVLALAAARLRRRLEEQVREDDVGAGAARRGRGAPARPGQRGGKAARARAIAPAGVGSKHVRARLPASTRRSPCPTRSGASRAGASTTRSTSCAAAPTARREEAVHEARKDMKKLRALLRLVRGELGERVYRRRERPASATPAAELAGVRDADVMLATLGDLEQRYGELPGAGGRLRPALVAHRFRAAAGSLKPASKAAVETLAEARDRVEDWPLRDGRLRGVRGRPGADLPPAAAAAYRAAQELPSAEHMHEWRKRVKDHWYHVTLLQDDLAAGDERARPTRRTSCRSASATSTTSRCCATGRTARQHARRRRPAAARLRRDPGEPAPRAPGGGVRLRGAAVRRQAERVRRPARGLVGGPAATSLARSAAPAHVGVESRPRSRA